MIQSAEKDKISSSGMGLLLLDASGHAVYSNTEAVRVLDYPNQSLRESNLDELLRDRADFFLNNAEGVPQSDPCWAFKSGKRQYLCHIFSARSPAGDFPEATVVLFERSALRSFFRSTARFP
jgi:hypothetical protein